MSIPDEKWMVRPTILRESIRVWESLIYAGKPWIVFVTAPRTLKSGRGWLSKNVAEWEEMIPWDGLKCAKEKNQISWWAMRITPGAQWASLNCRGKSSQYLWFCPSPWLFSLALALWVPLIYLFEFAWEDIHIHRLQNAVGLRDKGPVSQCKPAKKKPLRE